MKKNKAVLYKRLRASVIVFCVLVEIFILVFGREYALWLQLICGSLALGVTVVALSVDLPDVIIDDLWIYKIDKTEVDWYEKIEKKKTRRL